MLFVWAATGYCGRRNKYPFLLRTRSFGSFCLHNLELAGVKLCVILICCQKLFLLLLFVFVCLLACFLCFCCLFACLFFVCFFLSSRFIQVFFNPLQAGGGGGGGIVHLVQRPTEKPGAMLTQVRLPVAAR